MTTGTIIFAAGILLAVIAVVSTVIVSIKSRKNKQKLDEYLEEWY